MIHNLSDVVDEFGVECPQCRMPAFITKVEINPRIKKRFSFECVNKHRFQAEERAS